MFFLMVGFQTAVFQKGLVALLQEEANILLLFKKGETWEWEGDKAAGAACV